MQLDVACAISRSRLSVSFASASAVREPRDRTVPAARIRPVAVDAHHLQHGRPRQLAPADRGQGLDAR